VALGQHYAGLYSNDDTIAEKLYDSSINTNEKVWRMPLHDDFDKELNSPFVDLKKHRSWKIRRLNYCSSISSKIHSPKNKVGALRYCRNYLEK